MSNLAISNLEELNTLDGDAMREIRGGILPFVVGGGIVLGVGYAAYRFLVDDDDPVSVSEPVATPAPTRVGPMRAAQLRAESDQSTLDRLGTGR